MTTPQPIKLYSDPWGYSKLETFEKCPQKFKFQFMDKLPQPGSAAMERGSKMHDSIETYLNGWTKELIPECQSFQQAIDDLKAAQFVAEQALGLDKTWSKLPDWFAKQTWLRAKADAMYVEGTTLTVIDFKSGKYRVPSTDQVELYAIVGGAIYPEVTKVVAEYWYLDTGEVYSREYTQPELLALRAKFEKRVAPMYTNKTWNPEPSMECRWCPYSKTKGGKCQY
jgi:hypothetical protein